MPTPIYRPYRKFNLFKTTRHEAGQNKNEMKQNFDDLITTLEAEIKFKGILKKDLAEAAGIAPHTVSVILARKHVPGAAVLMRLFNAVGLEVFLRRVEDEE